MAVKVPHTFEVDNAAQIFVAINSFKETTMSRIALTLDRKIDKRILQQALNDTMQRFPYYQVYLRKRFFKYVFEHTDDKPEVEQDTKWTNRYVDFEKDHFPFRVKTQGATIALELSHVISDGYGTLVFLLSLTARYLHLNGISVEESPFIKYPDDEIVEGEWKCGFRQTFTGKGPPQKLQKPAYIPSGEMISVEKYYSTRIIMDLKQIRTLARNMNVTLNVYIAAIYTAAIQKLFFDDIKHQIANPNRPIRIQIPVNLRRYYPTVTMRNFSYLYSPVFYIKGSPRSFQEIVHIIADDIRHERHTKSIEHQIARNLRAENNFFFKILPRPLKTSLFKLFYHIFARSLFSGVITNLGNISLPPSMEEHIKSFDILPCNSPVPGRNTALFSYKGKLEMNIGSSVNDLRLENAVTEILTELNIKHEVIYKRDT